MIKIQTLIVFVFVLIFFVIYPMDVTKMWGKFPVNTAFIEQLRQEGFFVQPIASAMDIVFQNVSQPGSYSIRLKTRFENPKDGFVFNTSGVKSDDYYELKPGQWLRLRMSKNYWDMYIETRDLASNEITKTIVKSFNTQRFGMLAGKTHTIQIDVLPDSYIDIITPQWLFAGYARE